MTSLIAGFALASGAVRAQAPLHLYDASTDAYGEATAVATTTPSLTDPRSSYVVAAIPYANGDLEIKAWQDTKLKLVEIGHYHAGGNPISAVAAVGLDSSHVVTADVDQTGIFSLNTWTLGGSVAIIALNGYDSPADTAAPLRLGSPRSARHKSSRHRKTTCRISFFRRGRWATPAHSR